jgi:HSP20 family protein
MAITRYQPTSRELFDPFLEGIMGGRRSGSMLRAPDADVIETENEIRVTLDMPGMKSDDIELDLENNVLTIRGEKLEERSEEDEHHTWHLSERRYGQFSRSFILPRDVEQEQIKARFENGVLTVNIPKSEKAKRRRIEIGGDGGARETKKVETKTTSK